MFQDELINNFVLNNSNPDDDQCMAFSIQNNGSVHLTIGPPDGSNPCTLVLSPESDF